MINTKYSKAPNLSIKVSNETFAYREMGNPQGIPIILFGHLAANLDNWDPKVVEGIAQHRWVITFDNLGVGASTGLVPLSIEQMAKDALSFIHGLGFEKVDILGLSMGGMIAQELVILEPKIVNKLILAGTGPRGGVGIKNVSKISNLSALKSLFTFKDVKTYLFFTHDKNGRAKAKEFLNRLKTRDKNRDTKIKLSSYIRQLKAIKKFGEDSPLDLSTIDIETLIVNGDNDYMVPTINSYELNNQIKNSQLVIYPHAGHGSIFQNYSQFVNLAIKFLN